jgi:nucleotide-binding universal stress UspA family protein
MARKERPILVGFDASPEAIDALALAQLLAESPDSRVIVGFARGRRTDGREEESVRSLAEQHLGYPLTAGTDDRDAEWAAISARSPAQGLRELATRRSADVLVVGSTARGPLGRVLPGSTGRRLLHEPPCPVAIAPLGYRDQPATLGTIAVGFDGSDACRQAVFVAADLARASEALLRVVSIVDAEVQGHLGPEAGVVIETVEEERRDGVSRLLGHLPVGVHVEERVVCASLIPELTRQARDADLLVLGSHGYGPVRSALLGDVPSELVDSAPCPLLVVPLVRAAAYATAEG